MKTLGNPVYVAIWLSLTLLISCTGLSFDEYKESTLKVWFDNQGNKATLGLSEMMYHWNSNDCISVFSDAANVRYRFTGNDGDNVGDFIKTDEIRPSILFQRYYAIYPYSMANGCEAEGVFTVILPDVQRYIRGESDRSATMFAGMSDDILSGTLRLRSVCGYLKLRLIGEMQVRRIVLSGNDGEVICGTGRITIDDNGIPAIDMTGDGKIITLDFGTEGTLMNGTNENPEEVIFAVPPTIFGEGFTVTVEATDGHKISKATTSSKEIVRNTVTGMPAFAIGELTGGTSFLSFALTDGTNEYEAFSIKNGIINVKVPAQIDLSSMKAVFETDGISVTVNDVEQTSGVSVNDYSDFCNSIQYRITSKGGQTMDWVVNVFDLPILIIDTPGSADIITKAVRVEGCKMVAVNEDGSISDVGTAGIKLRGNSTAVLPKKPYNVKLDAKYKIFGLGEKKSKHWNLMANCYYDRTQLHNATANKFAKMLPDYPWVQDGCFCELILNGVHKGLYYICEKIRVEEGRIDIQTAEGGAEPDSGGYLLESVMTASGVGMIQTDHFNVSGGYPVSWQFNEPEENISQEQYDYVQNKLNNVDNLIYGDNVLTHEYLDYFDINTMIAWFLTEEVCQNEEASRTKNVFLYLNQETGKFYVGPPWDFDAWSFGYTNYKKWLIKTEALFLPGLFNDPYFVEKVKEKWVQYKEIWLNNGLEYFDEQRELIYRAAKRNDIMWPEWVSGFMPKTYEEYVNIMRNAILSRIDWMDNQINAMVVNYDTKPGGNEDVDEQDDKSGDFGFGF